MTYATLGTIIHATMRNEDLIPAFVDELERLNQTAKGAVSVRLVIEDARKVSDFDSEDTGDIVNELTDYLNDYAPPYAYFGSHPGDGSDYGFWVSEDVAQEISDNGGAVGSETPNSNTQSGECLVVSDHGNMTLYAWQPNANRITGSHWKEVWSIV